MKKNFSQAQINKAVRYLKVMRLYTKFKKNPNKPRAPYRKRNLIAKR